MQWRWVKLQCAMFDHVCAGTGSVVGLQVVGILLMVVATLSSLVGPFAGDKYKVFLIMTVVTLVLSWAVL